MTWLGSKKIKASQSQFWNSGSVCSHRPLLFLERPSALVGGSVLRSLDMGEGGGSVLELE